MPKIKRGNSFTVKQLTSLISEEGFSHLLPATKAKKQVYVDIYEEHVIPKLEGLESAKEALEKKRKHDSEESSEGEQSSPKKKKANKKQPETGKKRGAATPQPANKRQLAKRRSNLAMSGSSENNGPRRFAKRKSLVGLDGSAAKKERKASGLKRSNGPEPEAAAVYAKRTAPALRRSLRRSGSRTTEDTKEESELAQLKQEMTSDSQPSYPSRVSTLSQVREEHAHAPVTQSAYATATASVPAYSGTQSAPEQDSASASSLPSSSSNQTDEPLYDQGSNILGLIVLLALAAALCYFVLLPSNFTFPALLGYKVQFCAGKTPAAGDSCIPCPKLAVCRDGKATCPQGHKLAGTECVEHEGAQTLLETLRGMLSLRRGAVACYGVDGFLKMEQAKADRALGKKPNKTATIAAGGLAEPTTEAPEDVEEKLARALGFTDQEVYEVLRKSNAVPANEFESTFEHYKATMQSSGKLIYDHKHRRYMSKEDDVSHPFECAVRMWIMDNLLLLAGTCLSIAAVLTIRQRLVARTLFNNEVQEMLLETKTLLQKQQEIAANSSGMADPWVPVVHVRDTLFFDNPERCKRYDGKLPPSLWTAVEKEVALDRRVSTGQQVVEGTPQTTWEWVSKVYSSQSAPGSSPQSFGTPADNRFSLRNTGNASSEKPSYPALDSLRSE